MFFDRATNKFRGDLTIFLKTPNIISNIQERIQVSLYEVRRFFSLHKAFTFKELELNLSNNKDSPVQNSTIYNLITYHQNQGHILRIR